MRHVLKDPRYFEREHSVAVVDLDGKDLAEGIVGAEVLLRHRLGDHDCVGLSQRRARVATEQGEAKNIEQRGIRPIEAFLPKADILAGDQDGITPHPNGADDVRKSSFEGRRDRVGRIIPGGASLQVYALDTIDLVGLFVKAIKAKLIAHVEHNQQAARHPKRQPADVDRGIAPIAAQGA